LEGNFPPYEKVIPLNQNIMMKIDRMQLYQSLDRISQISDKESHKINFFISEKSLTITSEEISIGSGEETIPVESNCKDFNIFLNYMFVTEALNVIKNDNIIFEFKDPKNTIVIREENNDDFIYIMMPMT
jgi:DNA polymerase-3 subunit beta